MKKADTLYNLIWMSRPLMQAAEACVERNLAGSDLTVRMRAVLEILHVHGDLTVPDIAARLDIKRQYVQLMVNETVASGLATQRANPRHKRSTLISLSDAGRALIADVVGRERALMEEIAQDYSKDDLATALAIVQSVTSRLKATGNTS